MVMASQVKMGFLYSAVFLISAGACFANNQDDVAEGRDIWFKSTFGGERFFSLILPSPPFNLRLSGDQMLTSPRDTRFDQFGVINDPGCTPGDATTSYLDKCADPESAERWKSAKFAKL